MKATITLLLMGCLSCLTLHAQHDISIQWQRTIGTNGLERFDDIVNDARNVVTACSDGGYAVALLRPSNPASTCDRATWNGERLWLIKFNKFGALEWEKCYGAQFYAFWDYVSPGGLIQTADNGFLIVGGTSFIDGDFATNHGGDSYDAFAIKTDATGVKQWSRCYGGTAAEGFSSVLQDHDGNYVFVGQAKSNDGDVVGIHWLGSSGKDAWIVKANPVGNIIWQKCVGDDWNSERFSSVKMTSDSGYVAVGTITAKLTKSGTLVWSRHEDATDLAIDASDNIYTTGTQFSSGGGAQLRKITKTGSLVWSKSLFPGMPGTFTVSLQIENDTTIMVAGKTNDPAHMLYGMHWTGIIWNNDDIFLAQVDSTAKVKMLKCFGGTDFDAPVHFVPTPDKGYLILGLSKSSDGDVLQHFGDVDYWLIKVGNFNTVKGKLFYDYNNNATQDIGEDAFTNVLVTSEKGGAVNGWYSTDGTFSYTVDTGALVTKPVINRPYYTINPASLNTAHTTFGHTDTVSFAVVPTPGITDLSVSLSPQTPQRPGFANKLYLVVANHGTAVMQNAFVGIVPDPKITVTSHDSIGFSRNQDTLFWQVNNLVPGQAKTVTISIRNPAPPTMVNGDSLFHYVMAWPFASDSTDIDNRDTVRQDVVGSFDPNNKLDDMSGILYTDRYKNGDHILYTINFQNTGTDTAFTVVVRDTLSSLFNIGSFQMVDASHPYTLSLHGSRLQWTFNNILLVDSTTNEPRSHGYIVFRIKPKEGLNVNQVLSNTAAIYFDYNLPVITDRNDVKISVRPLARPVLAGLSPTYCQRSGSIKGKLANMPSTNTGIAVLVKLDNTTLTVAGDSTFSFDVATLSPGNHIISARFTQGNTTSVTEWPITITAATVLDLTLSASTTTVTNLTQPLIITGANAVSGTNLRYTYAKDRTFTAILQAESSNNVLHLDPATLAPGNNMIYGRINANGQCYTEASNMDSIQIRVNTVTGIVDVDVPGQSINVYPVPFDNHITLNGLITARTYQVSLVNMQGVTVYTASIKNRNDYRLGTAHLPAGAYVLHIKKEQKALGTITVIKQ